MSNLAPRAKLKTTTRLCAPLRKPPVRWDPLAAAGRITQWSKDIHILPLVLPVPLLALVLTRALLCTSSSLSVPEWHLTVKLSSPSDSNNVQVKQVNLEHCKCRCTVYTSLSLEAMIKICTQDYWPSSFLCNVPSWEQPAHKLGKKSHWHKFLHLHHIHTCRFQLDLANPHK